MKTMSKFSLEDLMPKKAPEDLNNSNPFTKKQLSDTIRKL